MQSGGVGGGKSDAVQTALVCRSRRRAVSILNPAILTQQPDIEFAAATHSIPCRVAVMLRMSDAACLRVKL